MPLLNDVLLVLTGDVNVQQRADPASAFRHVREMLGAADLLFGHLECPLHASTTHAGKPDIAHKPSWTHADPRMVEGLKAAGFQAMSLASNVSHPRHVGVATAETLDRVGIGHCGVGRTLAEARKPAILSAQGTRVGFLSYTSVFWIYDHAATETEPGCATLRAHTAYEPGHRALEMPGAPPIVHTWPHAGDLALMQDDIRALRRDVDVVVLSCHWGVSSSHETCAYQRALARAAIAAGADLVFGHHPHVVQGIETIDGKPVFYSLGNFAFDWERMRGRHREGMVVECVLRDRKLAGWRCRFVQRNRDNDIAPLDLTNPDGRDLAALVTQLSAAFGTSLAVDGQTIAPVAQPHLASHRFRMAQA